MRLGIVLRNMGPASTRETIAAVARLADATPAIDDLWVTDHLAIPPDDAEGSDGRYVEPLVTLAFLAAATTRVGLGTSVLVLPYRPPFLVAKWVASVQELSGGRMMLGVGIGWMAPEFRALGVDYRRRGALSDAALDLLDRCFAADVVEANGQPFLFRPRPSRPPLFVGGQPRFAFRRALAHGGGWMPMGLAPDALAPCVAELRAAAAGRKLPAPEVAVLTTLPIEDIDRTRTVLVRYAEAGATRVIHGGRYPDADAFRTMVERLAAAAS